MRTTTPLLPSPPPRARPGSLRFPRPPAALFGLAGALALGVLLVVPVAADEDPAAEEDRPSVEERVDEVFADIAGPKSPGCALSVMRDGAMVYRRGYGMANLEYGVPITPSSVFHIASTSKQFTAMAVALLVRDGEVSWDDDVRDYVPEVPDLGHRITLRHLVHHTSGLRDQWELLIMAGWRWEADLVTQDDVLDLLSRQRALNFEPGAEMLYCNTGFTLLAAVVERVSGKSLREFARERIFEPLGMEDTHFHDDHQRIVENRAYGYSRDRTSGELKISIPDFAIVGATSLFTTVEDLARWDRSFYTATVGGPAVLRDLLQRGTLADGEELDFGKGLIHSTYRGLPAVSHGGADAGYRSQLFRFPEQRFSVAVLCNFPSSDPTGRARKVADIYLAEVFPEPAEGGTGDQDGSGAAEPGATEPSGAGDETLAALAGYYLSPESDIGLRVVLEEGRLRLGSEDGPALAPLEGQRFRVGEEGEETAAFEVEGSGPRRLRLSETSRLPGRSGIGILAPPADPDTYSELIGDYWSDELGAGYRFEVVDGEPRLWNRKHGSMPLSPVYRDGFTLYFDLLAVAFTRDADGRVNGLTMSGPRARKVRFHRLDAAPGP